MTNYLNWKQETITDLSAENITNMYNQGFVFTRRGKGAMDQTRSMRIDLSQFALTSENKRILRKTEDISLSAINKMREKFPNDEKIAHLYLRKMLESGNIDDALSALTNIADSKHNNFSEIIYKSTKKRTTLVKIDTFSCPQILRHLLIPTNKMQHLSPNGYGSCLGNS